jgi:putative transposase
MARLPRNCPAGIPQHIIQRGNNRHACFVTDQDFITYSSYLKEYADQFEVQIHAWVFMTNHVHLLCTPNVENSISKMMQALGRRYVRFFNNHYRRTGTLWEGRLKSCLIEEENYWLQVYRYIELNPVRAGMVKEAQEYKWSSYQINALGKESGLFTPHPLYLRLGNDTATRLVEYQKLFDIILLSEKLDEIRTASRKGMAMGSNRFKLEIEQLTGRRVTEVQKGRPKKLK